ncbi:MFS transporter, partial [Actinoallomurus acaciae]
MQPSNARGRPGPTTGGGLRRSPDFLRLWAAQSISETGTQVGQLAVPLLAIGALRASPAELGFLAGARTVPFLVLSLPAGAILDRMRRRPVLIVADLCRAALLGSVPVAYALGVLSFLQLYAVAVLAGVFTVCFDVSYQSYLPALVRREHLTEANTRLTISGSAAEMVGPGAAGVLAGAIGAAATVLLDALSFLVSGLLCRAIRHTEPRPEAGGGTTSRSLRREVGEGLGFVLRDPLLSRIAACASLVNLASSMLTVLLTLYMVRTLGYPSALVGLVFALCGVGFVLGALIVGPVIRRIGYGRTITAGALVSAAGLAVLPATSPASSLPFLAAGQLVFGLGVPLFNVAQVTLRQSVTPGRLQARMNASMRFLIWGTLALGGPAGGFLAEAVGTRPAMAVAAVVGCLPLAPLLWSPVPAL